MINKKKLKSKQFVDEFQDHGYLLLFAIHKIITTDDIYIQLLKFQHSSSYYLTFCNYYLL